MRGTNPDDPAVSTPACARSALHYKVLGPHEHAEGASD